MAIMEQQLLMFGKFVSFLGKTIEIPKILLSQ